MYRGRGLLSSTNYTFHGGNVDVTYLNKFAFTSIPYLVKRITSLKYPKKMLWNTLPFTTHFWRQKLGIKSRPHPHAFTHFSLRCDTQSHLTDGALTHSLNGLIWGCELASKRPSKVVLVWHFICNVKKFCHDYNVIWIWTFLLFLC